MFVINDETAKQHPEDLAKVFFMALDVLIKEDDQVIISGLKAIVDYKGMSPSFIIHITPILVKNFFSLFAKCLSDTNEGVYWNKCSKRNGGIIQYLC